MIGVLLVLATGCIASARVQGSASPKLDVDWKSFLARSDPVWKWTSSSYQPVKWYHSGFVGNGEQGMMVRVDDQAPNNKLLFVVSSSAVWDDRMPGSKYALGNFVLDRPRLPVGQFSLSTVGTITAGSMRLDLYNGEVIGNVTTTKGSVSFTVFANSVYDKADVMAIQAVLSGGEASRTNAAVFEFTPKAADSTWGGRNKQYVPNPAAVMTHVNQCSVSLQKHLSGAAHATGFQEDQTTGTSTLTVTVMMSITHVIPTDAAAAACKQVGNARSAGFAAVRQMNSAWWNAYYPASFVSFSDTIMEGFYWVQMYKLASGTRSDREVYDLMGPWFIDGTGWPDLHWDLNVQLTYYPLYAANRLDIAESLKKLLDNNMQALINNVPEEYRNDSAAAPTGASSDKCMETCYWDHGANCTTSSPSIVGNLMWTLQLYFYQYRYSMDEGVAKDLFPILRRAVNYYTRIQFLQDGHFHLPVTFSPEYPGKRSNDTNYDLALYRWGLQTVIHLTKILDINDPNLDLWTKSLKQLVSYSMDDEGNYGIAAGVPFNIGHRHFSHLFMVWPLATIDWNNASSVDTGRQSVDHWLTVSKHSGLTGFCRPPFAVMSMLFDRRDSVYTNLTFLVDNYILPNTFYHEGENGECGETPPMAASALQDMMLYYWGNVVHVFAGIAADKIPDSSFHRLRTEGAYLFSSVFTQGATQWIYIEYDSPTAPVEDLIIKTDMVGPLVAVPSTVKVTQNPDGTMTVTGLKSKGDAVMLYSSKGAEPDFTVSPVKAQEQYENYWGYHAKPSSTPPQAVQAFPDDLTVVPHRNIPNTFSFQSETGQCLAVDGFAEDQHADVVMAKCLQPGESHQSSSKFCDACQQHWIVHKHHLVSQATGQCVLFTGPRRSLKHTKCPFTVTHDLLHPAEPFPWSPPVHAADVQHRTDSGAEFLVHNRVLRDHDSTSWAV
ncbi:uncharacterized protein LOC135805383 [Sycon ciliatum]|uniref:uncharacterized protein LOC135805383 n=1 Tax=Sycon ciliatum TaxID=27933 RepID=UPI0031F61BE4